MSRARRPVVIGILGVAALATLYTAIVAVSWAHESRSLSRQIDTLEGTLDEAEAELSSASTCLVDELTTVSGKVSLLIETVDAGANATDDVFLYGETALALEACNEVQADVVLYVMWWPDYVVSQVHAYDDEVDVLCLEIQGIYDALLSEDAADGDEG